MRRPLCMVAVFLVALAAVRLEIGGAEGMAPGLAALSVAYGDNTISAAETLQVTGQVYQKDEKTIYLKNVILSVPNAYGQSMAGSLQNIPCKENFICETGQALSVPLGSTVTLKGAFSPFSRATNPGEFDSAAYYRTLGIKGKIKKAEILSKGEDYWFVREGLSRLKYRFRERLYSIFSEKDAAVMSALLLGDKGDLDSQMKDLYKRNGILHILSISSLHITIIGMSVYKLLRKVGTPICPAAIGGSLLLLLYGGMTGFSISACRAIGMYLIKMLAEVAGRTYDMLTALGVIAVVMMAGNPYYLQNSGFLLSFASVLGIGVVYPALMPKKVGGMGKKLLEPVLASLSITLATLPVQLWFYYEVPVYSVFLNLLVIPFVKPLVIAGLLLLVPGFGIPAYVDHVILRGYEFLCTGFDRLPFRTWNPGCPKLWQIAGYYLLLVGAVIIRSRRKKMVWGKSALCRALSGYSAKFAVSICAICAAMGLLGFPALSGNIVMFLDVGQGDCILVRTDSGQTYLFDCGSSRGNVGKYVLLPCLKYYGIHRIDAVFLSHPDADHVNGVLELLEFGAENGIAVGEIVLPAIEKGARGEQFEDILEAAANAGGDHVPVGYLSAGDCWGSGSAFFTCLHPQEGFSGGDANVYSECIYAEFREKGGSGQKWSLLLTGDVEGAGEESLLKEILERGIRAVTVLKAAHHGSRNSTSEELLEQVSPMLTVISCGRDNSYGHPHIQLLERLEESGTYIVQTARCGAVTVTFRGGALHVASHIEQ